MLLNCIRFAVPRILRLKICDRLCHVSPSEGHDRASMQVLYSITHASGVPDTLIRIHTYILQLTASTIYWHSFTYVVQLTLVFFFPSFPILFWLSRSIENCQWTRSLTYVHARTQRRTNVRMYLDINVHPFIRSPLGRMNCWVKGRRCLHKAESISPKNFEGGAFIFCKKRNIRRFLQTSAGGEGRETPWRLLTRFAPRNSLLVY